MDKKLYKMMNWPQIEAIIYSDTDVPGSILGAHDEGNGTLVQMFDPNADAVTLIRNDNEKRIPMSVADEDGFFAVYIPSMKAKDLKYHYEILKKDKTKVEREDPYRFAPYMTKEDISLFQDGIHYEIYKKLGAHPLKFREVRGIHFAVYAPNCQRVSVVGSFNDWDGRCHQLNQLGDSGFFQLFIPDAAVGDYYKYEIKKRSGEIFVKADPYEFSCEKGPDGASIIAKSEEFTWHDEDFLKEATTKDADATPLSIYEVSTTEMEENAYTKILQTSKEQGFTHCLFPSIRDESGLFTFPLMESKELNFKAFVDQMHQESIGVMLTVNLSSFPDSTRGLAFFDGGNLYESEDPLIANTPEGGSYYYDYHKKCVINYLLSYVSYIIREFHIDGIVVADTAKMLYLDFDKEQHRDNIYGTNENLDAQELLKHFNSMVHSHFPQVITVAKDSAAYPRMTGSFEEDGLDFTFRYHDGWFDNALHYFTTDPLFREGVHNDLTLSMVYQYTDRFLLPMDKECMISEFAGDTSHKYDSLRLFICYLMLYPGKKLLRLEEMDKNAEYYQGLLSMITDLNSLYRSQKALSLLEEDPTGFTWIKQMANEQCTLAFLRCGTTPKDSLLVVMNGAGVAWEQEIGVPYPGKYKEVFYSTNATYGGSGTGNAKVVKSEEGSRNGRENFITLHTEALSLHVFSYQPYSEKELAEIEAMKEKNRLRRKMEEAMKKASEAKALADEYRERAEIAIKEAEDMQKAADIAKKAADKEAELLKKAEEKQTLETSAKSSTVKASSVKKAPAKRASVKSSGTTIKKTKRASSKTKRTE